MGKRSFFNKDNHSLPLAESAVIEGKDSDSDKEEVLFGTERSVENEKRS